MDWKKITKKEHKLDDEKIYKEKINSDKIQEGYGKCEDSYTEKHPSSFINNNKINHESESPSKNQNHSVNKKIDLNQIVKNDSSKEVRDAAMNRLDGFGKKFN